MDTFTGNLKDKQGPREEITTLPLKKQNRED